METSLACIHTYPHCCCCAACIRFGAFVFRQRSFCFLYCDINVSPFFGVVRLCFTLSFPVSAWYQKTRRALLRARCLLLLLLLASRQQRAAVCGVRQNFQNFMQWSGNKRTILCQSEHERISPHPRHTHITKHFFIYGYSLCGPASWIHTKGDTSGMPIVQPTEHPRTFPPGSTGSEQMPLYPSCVCLLESSVLRAVTTGALAA